MKLIDVHLSQTDRQAVEAFRSKGSHAAREINRAHILAALDDQVPDEEIGAVLGVSRKLICVAELIWRTRSAYQEKGLAYALNDVRRPGAPRKYRPDHAQTEVAAVACSLPPAGAKRWTIKLLVAAVGQRAGLQGINRETVRQCLKKRLEALAQSDVVCGPDHRRISPTDVRAVGIVCAALRPTGTGRLRG